jgi:hypothetical protein
MNHLSQLCEGINKYQISLVSYKGHNFSHGLNNIGFHCQLEKTILNIQILC